MNDATARLTRGHQGRAGAAEWIEDHIAVRRKTLDERHKRRNRLLGWMHAVAGVAHLQHVGNRLFRLARLALGQEISLLVLIAEEAVVEA
jgi:hypothetical protein